MFLPLSVSASTTLLCLAVLVSACASNDPIKVHECCKTTSARPIPTPITACRIQKAEKHCVHAVIFTSEGIQYCSKPTRWAQNKIYELQKNGIPCPKGNLQSEDRTGVRVPAVTRGKKRLN